MNSIKTLFFILLFVGCAAQIASDIYAPSLLAISLDLHVTISQIQFSMAMYMVGFAVSQLFYGPLSEGLGRRIPLIIGLTLLFLGTAFCLFSNSFQPFVMGRFIQGCGAGACSVISRSIFRDRFEGVNLAKYGSYFSIFITFIVPAAPALGGYLQEQFNWRASIVFLSIYLIITLIIVLIGLNETSKYHHMQRLKLSFVKQSYWHILSNPIFMGYSICTFLCYGAFFSWFTVGPVLLIDRIGISPLEFGWITLFGGGIATAIGGWINGLFIEKLGAASMLRLGFSMMAIAGITMLCCHIFFGMSSLIIILPMILFYFGLAFIWPSVFAGSLNPFAKMAGYAGALYGFMQVSGAAVIGILVSYIPHENQIPLSLIFISAAFVSWLVFEKMVRRKEKST